LTVVTDDRFLCVLCEYEFGPGRDHTPCPRCGFTHRMNAQGRVRIRVLTKGRSGRRRNHVEWFVRQEPRGDGKGRVGRLTSELSVVDRMSFEEARAEDLSSIPDASVDVVTVRSVLIYVDDKASAFRAFYRVLRPGGRLSIFEPINNYFADSTTEFWGLDARPIQDLVQKVWDFEGWDEGSYESDPMMNFTEKDP
jgi:SAM-dependent methyltransferase